MNYNVRFVRKISMPMGGHARSAHIMLKNTRRWCKEVEDLSAFAKMDISQQGIGASLSRVMTTCQTKYQVE